MGEEEEEAEEEVYSAEQRLKLSLHSMNCGR